MDVEMEVGRNIVGMEFPFDVLVKLSGQNKEPLRRVGWVAAIPAQQKWG